MKSARDFRAQPQHAEDSLRKASKLEPNKKSGKERHHMLGELDEDDEIDDFRPRESVLDYMDDGEEE